MGLIRVSDDAEKKIKEAADASGSTITTTVDKMLQSNDIASRLDKMGKWLEKRFEDLEANILAEGAACSYTPKSSSSSYSSNTHVEWPVVQDVMFEFLPDGAEEWLPGMEEAARGSDNLDLGTFFIEGDLLVSNDSWGKAQWLRISPRVKEYLSSRGVL